MHYVCLLQRKLQQGIWERQCGRGNAGQGVTGSENSVHLFLMYKAAQMHLCAVLLLLTFGSRATSKTSTHSKHMHATVADQPGSQVITVGQSQTTASLLRQVRDDSLDPRHITWKSLVKLMVLSDDARVQMAIGILCCTVGVYARRKPTRQHHLSQGCIQQTTPQSGLHTADITSVRAAYSRQGWHAD